MNAEINRLYRGLCCRGWEGPEAWVSARIWVLEEWFTRPAASGPRVPFVEMVP